MTKRATVARGQAAAPTKAVRPRGARQATSRVRTTLQQAAQVDLGIDSVWVKASRSQVESAGSADVALHADIWREFEDEWQDLQEAVWTPMLATCGGLAKTTIKVDVRWEDPRLGLLAKTLQAAFWWAWDMKRTPGRPEQLRAAAQRLNEIDAGVKETAQRLAELLDERDALIQREEVTSHWYSPGIDLWALLETSAARPEFSDWAAVLRRELRSFLIAAQTQTREAPRLSTVLRLIAECPQGSPAAARYPEDQAIVEKSGGRRPENEMPDQVQRFLGMLLDSWSDHCGYSVEWKAVKRCLRPPMLSMLLRVAAGYGSKDEDADESLTEGALRGALARFDPNFL